MPYQPHQLSCGYEDFPPDMSKRVISAIKITDPFFCVQVGQMGIHADAKFGNYSLSVF